MVLSGCNTDIEPECDTSNCDINSYEYPTIEWGNYKPGQERRGFFQIPADIVERMTTKALVQAILDHPLL